MKKIFFLGFLIFFIQLNSFSQNQDLAKEKMPPKYSLQNLQQASLEDLELYLIKAKKLKKTGARLSIGGPITAVAGFAMFSASWSGNFGGSGTAGAGLIMFLGGAGVTVVGLPILITGSSRVNRINKIKATTYNGIRMDIIPNHLYNSTTQDYYPGVTLRLTF